MKTCREIELLLPSYVEGEASAIVDAHLDACAPCRAAASGERTARALLVAQRARLRGRAPEALQARCRAAAREAAAGAAADTRRPALTGWRTLVPLSLAASILLAVAGVFIYSAVNQAEALAAQLAFDHAKCASMFASPGPGDPIVAAERWEGANGWAVRVAAGTPEHDLEFVSIRRCLVTEGRTAHLMYKWRGQPLSLFVLPNAVDAVGHQRLIDRFGYGATMWSAEGRTYIVVAKGRADEMAPVVRYVRAQAR